MEETQVGEKLRGLTAYDRMILRAAADNGGIVCANDYEMSFACTVMTRSRLMTDEGRDVFALTGIGCAVADFVRRSGTEH